MKPSKEIGDRLRKVREFYNQNSRQFALGRGFSPSVWARVEKGTTGLPDSYLRELLLKSYLNEEDDFKPYHLSLDWLLREQGEMMTPAPYTRNEKGEFTTEGIEKIYNDYVTKGVTPLPFAETPSGFQRNARVIGLPVDVHTPKSGITHIELSEGYYMMYAPHVTERARAGFQGGGYSDPVYVESLPKYPMIVNTVHKGSYFVFDITGDSMNDGTLKSIPDKSKVLGREIKMDLWQSRFHYNEYPYFVVVHRTDGLLCKEIIAHDVKRGIIRCRSLNPNKKMYPDFDVPLNDCLMICNIVKKELPANV